MGQVVGRWAKCAVRQCVGRADGWVEIVGKQMVGQWVGQTSELHCGKEQLVLGMLGRGATQSLLPPLVSMR